jgi:hypothetical protein
MGSFAIFAELALDELRVTDAVVSSFATVSPSCNERLAKRFGSGQA